MTANPRPILELLRSFGSGCRNRSGFEVRGRSRQRCAIRWASMGAPATTKHVFVTGGVASSLGKGLTASSLGKPAQGARSAGDHAEARSLPERRSRDDEPLPARRGLRHRRRRRDRPGRRALRALPRHRPATARPTSRPGRSTPRSSPRSGAGSTWATPCRSSRTSPTRSSAASGRWPSPDVDVVITEVGGTVGDIESLPFLEAIRQIRHEVGREQHVRPARLAAALHRPVR